MALIDVSELMSDPDFVDPIQIIRRSSAINSFGENVVTEITTINTVACVAPAGGKTLQRLDTKLQASDVREFYTQTELLSDANDGDYPDIIVYKGERFAVQFSVPYLNYGSGFNQIVAVRERVQ